MPAAKKSLCFVACLFLLLTIHSSALARGQFVFGPKEVSIGRWHICFSRHVFRVQEEAEGAIHITKKTLGKRIEGIGTGKLCT